VARSRFGLLSTSPLIYLAVTLIVGLHLAPAIVCSVSAVHAGPSPTSPSSTNKEISLWLHPEVSTSNTIEAIPAQYRKRYLQWKNEYLSTEADRDEWAQYAYNPNFTLTITISKDEGQGARVDRFRWDESGKLVAATIILGNKLDSGYPSAINYPITCSLAPGNLPPEVKGKILAATKLAHEFGHLNQVLNMDGNLYQLQNSLMIQYNQIFNANGYNVHDPRLVELAGRMGGTPVSIKQDREHWAEIGAIHYLIERLPELSKRSKMPLAIRHAIDSYYLTYPERLQIVN